MTETSTLLTTWYQGKGLRVFGLRYNHVAEARQLIFSHNGGHAGQWEAPPPSKMAIVFRAVSAMER
jgi:hypothetical protein